MVKERKEVELTKSDQLSSSFPPTTMTQFLLELAVYTAVLASLALIISHLALGSA